MRLLPQVMRMFIFINPFVPVVMPGVMYGRQELKWVLQNKCHDKLSVPIIWHFSIAVQFMYTWHYAPEG
jgi:hypothetical protein